MNDLEFLNCIKESFIKFLQTGSRSNEKLIILHGSIAHDLQQRLGKEYCVKSLGIGDGKEGKIEGRYIDKNVDITVYNSQNKVVAGIGVKFVMQNYAQNSNNYFENMLGETANIRCNQIPYFQIFIVPDHLPYYNDKKVIKRWEVVNNSHVGKYIKLSSDNPDIMFHSPTKTLFYIIHIPKVTPYIQTQSEYRQFYLNHQFDITKSNILDNSDFGSGVMLNQYNDFMTKITHRILSE